MVRDHASADRLKHRQLEQAALSLAAQVTTQVLMDSNAGKLVRRLTKHANASVASAAGSVVSSWKEAIAREQRAALGDAAGMPAGPLHGHLHDRRSQLSCMLCLTSCGLCSAGLARLSCHAV